MNIFNFRGNDLFEIAKISVKNIANLLDNSSEEEEGLSGKAYRIIPNDSKSPVIYFLQNDRHIIYYPAYSTHYTHSYDDRIKIVKVISGTIYEKKTGKVYSKGDTLVIQPNQVVEPYTQEGEAYVKVQLSWIKQLIRQVCN
jgi:hypothetical protein